MIAGLRRREITRMSWYRPVVIGLYTLFSCISLVAQMTAAKASSSGKPANAAAGDVTTDYFGTRVADPYRWMEAGPRDPKFLTYLQTQNEYTRQVLASLGGREKLLQRIRDLDNA